MFPIFLFPLFRTAMVSAASFLIFLVLCLPRPSTASRSDNPDTLRIVFVDVEGGQATLFVTPSKQSLLIDTGWPENNGRDADRIVAAAKSAGLSKLDYVLITHFHTDHVGGLAQLVDRIPVGTVIDHGDNRESTDAPTVAVWQVYQRLLEQKKFKRLTVKPGDEIAVTRAAGDDREFRWGGHRSCYADGRTAKSQVQKCRLLPCRPN